MKLFPLIKTICDGTYSPMQLTEFINISQKIAISYLKYLEINGRNIRPRNQESSNELENVAIDCIASLFMRNESGEFVQLTRYFGQIINSPEPPAQGQLSNMLRRLIVKKTKQELSRIFKERDPEGAKIIRNIKVAIRNSQKFSSIREMGREFVYLNPRFDNCQTSEFEMSDTTLSVPLPKDLKKKTIPERELFHFFLEKYQPSDSVSAMLDKIMNIVVSLPQYHNYLAVDLIASIIREVTFQHAYEQLSNDVDRSTPLDDIQSKEIDKVNRHVIRTIHQKIHSQYLLKNKISPQKADIYCRAISDFVYELTRDKATDSNYQYLKRYLPALTQRTYRQKERSIFEYLIKLTKKSLRKKLSELL
ncbi:MAG: hypothetical protein GXO74_04455 [Calditrichaeota bacterium]|nr:hypothetical protein [Calditrichota bacterium]